MADATSEIVLNGNSYRVSRIVEFPSGGSVFAPVINQGETTDATGDAGRSAVAYRSATGGIGVDLRRAGESEDTAWFSTLRLDHANRISLPPKIEPIDSPDSTETCSLLVSFGLALYGIFSDKLYKLGSVDGDWSDALATLDGTISDRYNAVIVGTNLYIPYGSKMIVVDKDGVVTQEDVNIAKDPTKPLEVRFSAVFESAIYALTKDGGLVFYDPFEETPQWSETSGKLDTEATSLTVGFNASGIPALYATTATGIQIYDTENAKWLSSGIQYPFDPSNGLGSTTWNGVLQYPLSDGTLLRYQAGQTALVSVAGPERPDGFHTNKRPTIDGICTDLGRVYLFVHFDSPLGMETEFLTSWGRAGGEPQGFRGAVLEADAAPEAIVYRGTLGGAWNIQYTGENRMPKNLKSIYSVCAIGRIGGRYGLIFYQVGGDLSFIELHSGVFNPNVSSPYKVVHDKPQRHEYSAFDAEDISLPKSALELSIEYILPPGCQIKVLLEIHDDTGVREIEVADLTTPGSGRKTLYLPTTGAPTGILFNKIRPILSMLSATDDVTPIVERLEFAFTRKINPRRAFEITIPAGSPETDNANEIYQQLRTLHKSPELAKMELGDDALFVNVFTLRSSLLPDRDDKQIQQIIIGVQEEHASRDAD